MKYSLSSHHVFRDDLSAMKYSVEFRYPYLSNDLIDYVSALPQNMRFNGIQNKPFMKYSLSSHHVFRDDLSAMKYSVEFRYPYLSNDL
ncbi:asparagine synthase-related protein, partial [Chryseobacterium sp. CH1]|uniref:asparagine synthase-related protein n=1 Tax=Chryseobacterium sp. CH1 TaxID=713551 RepID=UPI0010279F53